MNIHTYTYTPTQGGESMNALTVQNNTAIQTGATVTADLFNRFIGYIDASPKTVETYTKAVRQFVKYIAERGITQPTRETVIAYREELKRTHKPSTVQNYIIALRQFFKWTEQEGLYPDISDKVKGAKLTKEHKKDYLTSSQVKGILSQIATDTPQGRRDFAIFALMVTCGLRDIEVHRANIEDLRTLGDSTVLYLQGKGRTERAEFVKIPAATEKAIRASIADREDATGEAPLFVSLSNNSKGNRMTTRSISGTVKKHMKRAGYDSERLTAHSLRHTAVTLSLLGGNDIQEVREFARHSNINTTMIYAHNIDRMNNNCSSTIADAIF